MMRESVFSLLREPKAELLKGKSVLVLGLGDSGFSAAKWIEHEGGRVRAADTRAVPPRRKDFSGELRTGPFQQSLLDGMDLVCVSPGISLEEEIVAHAVERGVPIVGDIELFAWHVRTKTAAKVLAITGTNGKTTVTSLTGHLLRSAGIDCEVAGNIGPAALDSLLQRRLKNRMPAVWVLELSSYQLETTWSLKPNAAAMLNLSEDHLDRYRGLADYGAAKARIFQGAGVQVLNRADARSLAMRLPGRAAVTFGLDAPDAEEDFGCRDGWLVQGRRGIVARHELAIHGAHNASNALAACALAAAAGVSLQEMGPALRSFRGLAHRVELIAARAGVEWYDDSKGTNVGATIAALEGLGKRAVLILGGEGKGQDFAPLAPVVARHAKKVLLIGRDAPLIEKTVGGERCPSLEQAVGRAAEIAQPGEAVLLSPACASFDMFRDYKHRGEVFAAAVRALPVPGGPQ